jgi:hypothetical protein
MYRRGHAESADGGALFAVQFLGTPGPNTVLTPQSTNGATVIPPPGGQPLESTEVFLIGVVSAARSPS